jgi:alanine dehydrogenase
MGDLSRLKVVTASEVEELLGWDLVDDIRSVLLSDAQAPPRVSLTRGGVWLGVMPGAGLGVQAVKIVGVYPANPRRGLPLVRGLLVAVRESDGEPLYIADAAPLTAYRTAAATCFALSLLGYRGEEPVAIVGAGVQGSYHARCLGERYGIDEILVVDEDRVKAEELAKKLGGGARVAGSRDEIYGSKLIVTATTSTRPVVEGSKLRRGTYVASIGAPRPVSELDEEALRRAACILADTVEGYWSEAGEASYTPEWVKVVDLRSLARGEESCDHGDIAIYKSVGTALFDLAAALYLGRKLGLLE